MITFEQLVNLLEFSNKKAGEKYGYDDTVHEYWNGYNQAIQDVIELYGVDKK